MKNGEKMGELEENRANPVRGGPQKTGLSGWKYLKICKGLLKEREEIAFNLTANSAGDCLDMEPTDCFCH